MISIADTGVVCNADGPMNATESSGRLAVQATDVEIVSERLSAVAMPEPDALRVRA